MLMKKNKSFYFLMGKTEKPELLESLESSQQSVQEKTVDIENNRIKITCFIEIEACRLNGEQEINLENFTFI